MYWGLEKEKPVCVVILRSMTVKRSFGVVDVGGRRKELRAYMFIVLQVVLEASKL